LGRYDAEWEIYRRLRLSAVLLALGIPPLLAAFVLLSRTANARTFLGILVILYAALFFITQLRFTFFLCPRCHKWFSRTWRFDKGIFARKCVHCGLKKFSDGEDQVDLRGL
jgi:Zn ribbon nucleic-acid-binding protein